MELNLKSAIVVFVAALVISSGLVAGGFFIGNGVYKSRMADRFATVKVGELIKKGLVLADNNGPSYIFTKLNDVKPEMLAEATKNARKAAEQFAADSGSKVGEIRRAYQGVFDIQAANQTSTDSGDGMSSDQQSSQIDKKVRVVSTIDYSLAN